MPYSNKQKDVRAAIKQSLHNGSISTQEMDAVLKSQLGYVPEGQEKGTLLFGIVKRSGGMYSRWRGKKPSELPEKTNNEGVTFQGNLDIELHDGRTTLLGKGTRVKKVIVFFALFIFLCAFVVGCSFVIAPG